jgi:signal peptide peptidase SppA
MSSISTLLLQIHKGVWAIHQDSANSFMPVVSALLQGKKQDYSVMLPSASEKDNDGPKSEYAKGHNMYALSMADNTYNLSLWDNPQNAPKNSISVLPIRGAIMKYDYCGSPGTTSMSRLLKEADANQNITAHILLIDSPGGAADGTLNLSESIKSLNKPVYAFIDGMCASAAYWIASASKEIYTSGPLDMVGSIGTYLTLYDYREYLANEGIKVIEIYATKSTDKNADYKAALDNNDKLIKKNLIDPFNEAFLNGVKTNRSQKQNFNAEEVLTGKVFLSADAQKYGLTDGTMTLEALVNKISKSK